MRGEKASLVDGDHMSVLTQSIGARGRALDALLDPVARTGVGVHDGLSTVLAAKAGFDFIWISSFATSAVSGLPDAGLLDSSDMAAVVGVVRRSCRMPIVVDMDAGYGDELKVSLAAGLIARAGADAICIEDNPTSKRSSLYDGYARPLVSTEEHLARIVAAKAGIGTQPCAVIARTESLVAGRGVDEALARTEAYVEGGADAIFVQCVDAARLDELLEFCNRWERRTALYIAPTRYPQVARERLHDAGATHYIYANQAVRAAHRAMAEVFQQLVRAEGSLGIEPTISTVREVASDLGEAG